MPELEIIDAHKHNLKHLHLKIPKKKVIVITGVSGSGKSSLAYDTIFQEGQRKYLESLSTYARQFIKSLERPDVQTIQNISPTISIDQKHSSFYFNSTVGTISEITPYLRLLLAKVGEARCPRCGKPISRYSAQQISEHVLGQFSGRLVRLFSPVVKNRKGVYGALFEKYRKRGFLKALINGTVQDLDNVQPLDRHLRHHIAIQIDALDIHSANRQRIAESVNLALAEGNGEMLLQAGAESRFFSTRLYCPDCELALKEPQPGTFSINSPEGACAECQGRGTDANDQPCTACQGSGLNDEARSFYFRGKNIFALGEMEVVDLLEFFKEVRLDERETPIARPLLPQIVQRLESLVRLNMGYISLNRKITTLSGGELQRSRLVSQIGFSLNGIIYILDEPSIGMHASEQLNLLRLLRVLQEKGNTVIIVEHDEATIKAADFIVDMGPGAGERGGEVIYAGEYRRFHACRRSLTADYIFLRKAIQPLKPQFRPERGAVAIRHIGINNIRDTDLEIPLNALTVVSGVSGSGKSSLIVDALYPILQSKLHDVPLTGARLSSRRSGTAATSPAC